MTKTEIIILIIVIFISVTLVSLFLDKVFKTKTNKQEKKVDKKEKVEEIKEAANEPVKEESTITKDKKENKHPPHISLALQDELNEFKDYLKARITPEIVSDEERIKHSYDMPKINRNFDDFDFPSFEDEDGEFPFRKQSKKESAYETLPDDVKILLFTNFFDTKF